MGKFLNLWFLAMIHPREAYKSLSEVPAPKWGFYSTLVRFIGTAVTSILALYLLNKTPFIQSYVTFLDETNYYTAEIFFLPFFGIVAWLLSSGLIHLILRLFRIDSSIDWIMNVIGFSLLVVMPVVWLVDWATIAIDVYGATFTIPIHTAVSVWEVTLMAVGFRRIERVSWFSAALLGLIVKGGVYIPLAAIFVR
ncbi:MAG: hypothetical protein JSV25_11295 [Spirochaetota bacterium]|nr:MAG: hypothetical protein JSV25_11295 [Spirochaetota bacterium]